jgi:hypothetical protein
VALQHIEGVDVEQVMQQPRCDIQLNAVASGR